MKVLKFGGTSIGSIEAICQVIQIIKKQRDNSLVLVFSAFGNTTDNLLNMAEFATDGHLQKGLEILKQIKSYHQDLIISFLSHDTERSTLSPQLNTYFSKLEGMLYGLEILGDLSIKT